MLGDSGGFNVFFSVNHDHTKYVPFVCVKSNIILVNLHRSVFLFSLGVGREVSTYVHIVL